MKIFRAIWAAIRDLATPSSKDDKPHAVATTAGTHWLLGMGLGQAAVMFGLPFWLFVAIWSGFYVGKETIDRKRGGDRTDSYIDAAMSIGGAFYCLSPTGALAGLLPVGLILIWRHYVALD